jgi:hypothetical protein
MVHRALQVWALPDRVADEDLRARLHAFAWDESLSDPELVLLAIEQALDLLHTFTGSALRLSASTWRPTSTKCACSTS